MKYRCDECGKRYKIRGWMKFIIGFILHGFFPIVCDDCRVNKVEGKTIK